MLGNMEVPTSGSAGLVSNTFGPDFGKPIALGPITRAINEFGDEVLVDSTGRIFAGDPGQLSTKDYVQKSVLDKANTQTLTSSVGVNTGHIVLVGLLGFLLLQGAVK
jgi:hypothetical protein